MELIFGIAFLIARFWFGLLILGIGVVSFVSAVNYDRLPYKKHLSDIVGVISMWVMGALATLIGVWVLFGCFTLDISI